LAGNEKNFFDITINYLWNDHTLVLRLRESPGKDSQKSM